MEDGKHNSVENVNGDPAANDAAAEVTVVAGEEAGDAEVANDDANSDVSSKSFEFHEKNLQNQEGEEGGGLAMEEVKEETSKILETSNEISVDKDELGNEETITQVIIQVSQAEEHKNDVKKDNQGDKTENEKDSDYEDKQPEANGPTDHEETVSASCEEVERSTAVSDCDETEIKNEEKSTETFKAEEEVDYNDKGAEKDNVVEVDKEEAGMEGTPAVAESSSDDKREEADVVATAEGEASIKENDKKVETMEEKVEKTEEKVDPTDEKVETSDEKVETTEEKVEMNEEKVEMNEEKTVTPDLIRDASSEVRYTLHGIQCTIHSTWRSQAA